MRARCVALLVAIFSLTSHCVRADPIDFDTQVMPVLTRQGCNAGSCHGAAIGRGGFKLSLFGSGAAADHDSIVHQLEGRRVNLADPDKSLLLRKPSEQIGHEGGDVLPEDSPAFELVHRWISEGARRNGRRTLAKLTVTPDQIVLPRPGDAVAVRVIANYGNGQAEDVTQWTVFQPSDPEAVSVTESGREFTVHRRGVHVVIGRFLDRVIPIRLTVPMHDAAAASDRVDSNVGAAKVGAAKVGAAKVGAAKVGAAKVGAAIVKSRVDEMIDAQLRKLNLPSSPAADDWMFVRRVTLDLTGRLPTADDARGFVHDASADKRSRLIRRLLRSDAFADYWALKWANGLGIDSKQLQPEGADAYHRWLVNRFRLDAPADETSRLMLTSVGDSYENGAVNFLRTGSSPGDLAEHASRVFMGVRMQCANCHDHPLDHWKQDDYHGLAAIFAKLRRGRVVTVSDRGEVTHPVTGGPAVPRIPGDRYLPGEVDGRAALADWLTSAENPYFAKAMVNRIWQHLMGRGLVDPVDDLRPTNPATHPELLRWMAEDFADHGFRVKHTIELICNSSVYGRDSGSLPGNEMDTEFYSHALIKPLEAEVVADAITDVTGIPLRSGADLLPRTVTLTNNRMDVPVLNVLGRCDRENSCSESGDQSVSLARTLHMINGELINKRVSAPSGRLHELLAANQDNAEVLDELFTWTLTRPSAPGSQYWQQQLSSIRDADPIERAAFFEDVLWGLMTSQAFATNH